MLAYAVLLAVGVILTGLSVLAGELRYLVPIRRLILERYWGVIGLYSLVAFFNLVVLFVLPLRKLGLKDTGRKLGQLDRELALAPERYEDLHGLIGAGQPRKGGKR